MCVMIGYVIRVYMAGCHATRLLYFSIIVFDTWKVHTLHITLMRAINAAQRYFTHKFRHSENGVIKRQRQFYA